MKKKTNLKQRIYIHSASLIILRILVTTPITPITLEYKVTQNYYAKKNSQQTKKEG